ncbi:hypothetical protein BC830DRAFT_1120000, partial [Chytriomyces sp. MP71]
MNPLLEEWVASVEGAISTGMNEERMERANAAVESVVAVVESAPTVEEWSHAAREVVSGLERIVARVEVVSATVSGVSVSTGVSGVAGAPEASDDVVASLVCAHAALVLKAVRVSGETYNRQTTDAGTGESCHGIARALVLRLLQIPSPTPVAWTCLLTEVLNSSASLRAHSLPAHFVALVQAVGTPHRVQVRYKNRSESTPTPSTGRSQPPCFSHRRHTRAAAFPSLTAARPHRQRVRVPDLARCGCSYENPVHDSVRSQGVFMVAFLFLENEPAFQHETNPAILSLSLSITTLLIPLVLRASGTQLNVSTTSLLLSVVADALHWDVVVNALFRVTRLDTTNVPWTELDVGQNEPGSDTVKHGGSTGDEDPDSLRQRLARLDLDLNQVEDLDFVIQMEDLDASDEFWGSASLLQSILANDGRVSTTAPDLCPTSTQDTINAASSSQSPSPTQFPQIPLDAILATLSATSIRRSADALFTLLYTLFPSAALAHARQACTRAETRGWNLVRAESRCGGGVAGDGYVSARDPFQRALERLLELDVLDESLLVRQRVSNLVKAHRMHPSLLFGSAGASLEEELSAVLRTYHGKDTREVLVDCMIMRCNAAPSLVVGSTAAIPVVDVGSVNVESVLMFNRGLRKAVLDHTASSRPPLRGHTSAAQIAPTDTAAHHLVLMLNELHYELCLRGAAMAEVLKMRRGKIVEEVAVVDRENVYMRLRSQQQELAALHSTVDQLRGEAATTRDRHRRYEEDLNRRLRGARDAAREAKEALVLVEEAGKAREAEVERLTGTLDTANLRIHHLEQELHLVSPELEKLAEWEHSVKSLTSKFVQRELESSTREALQRQIDKLESHILTMDLSLASSQQEVKELHTKLEMYENGGSVSSSEVLAKQEETAAQMETMRATNAEMIRAVEEKYQALRQINLALESRLFDL